MKMLNWFKGKKSYIVGIAIIALGIYTGNNEMVLHGLGLMALRNAM